MGSRIKTNQCNVSLGEPFIQILDGINGEIHVTHSSGCLALKPKHAKRLAKQILALLEEAR